MKKVLVYSLLILCALLFIFPILWMLSTALKSPEEIFTAKPELIPKSFHFENFIRAWTAQPFNLFLKNTLFIALISTPFQVFSSLLVAYGFARIKFTGRNALFLLVLGTMIIPWDVTIIPLYIQYNYMGLINTLWPMILPGIFGAPFFIFLARQFIMGIPFDLDEAAKIDGCNRFQIWWRIILPLSMPIMVVIMVFHFNWVWNEFLLPLIFINDQSLYTLTLGINLFKNAFKIEYELLMAISLITVLIPLGLFYFSQNYILGGISMSGVKK